MSNKIFLILLIKELCMNETFLNECDEIKKFLEVFLFLTINL